MELTEQIRGIFFSFFCAFFMCLIYTFLNRIMYRFKLTIIRIVIQLMVGSVFGLLYYFGLVIINDGIISIYFIVFFCLGYFVFQTYYCHKWLITLEKIIMLIKFILTPIYFLFRKFRGIMSKVKKVIKWQEVEEKN